MQGSLVIGNRCRPPLDLGTPCVGTTAPLCRRTASPSLHCPWNHIFPTKHLDSVILTLVDTMHLDLVILVFVDIGPTYHMDLKGDWKTHCHIDSKDIT